MEHTALSENVNVVAVLWQGCGRVVAELPQGNGRSKARKSHGKDMV
jgi:hypothetical protein